MSTPVHERRRGWLKYGNPPGDLHASPRCGARTRRGTSCLGPAMKNGRCKFQFSAYREQRIVVVGVSLGDGDLQATLTWNTTADIDLHIVEPNGAEEVYYANRIGPTATLDRDDTDGFGPENIFVARGRGTGIYRIFIVHYGGLPPTTATVAIRVINHVTQREESEVVTFRTAGPNRALNINIATVDTRNGQIITLQGDTMRLSDEREFEYLKPARSPGQQ